MAKKTLGIIIISVVALCAAAAVAAFSFFKPEDTPKGRQLLKYVPTDAIGLLSCERAETALETLFDSDSYFRALDFEPFKVSRIVVSYHYLGTLQSLMLLDVGRKDVNARIQPMKEHLDEQGIPYRLITDPQTKDNIFAVCQSETVLESAILHTDENTSILEMDGLTDIVKDLPPETNIIIFSNKDLSRLAGKQFLSNYFSGKARNNFFDFIGKCADWTVLKFEKSEPSGKGEYIRYSLDTVIKDELQSYLKVIDSQVGTDSRVSDILPHKTTYLVDLPIDNLQAYLQARDKYLDASGKLVASNKARANFEKRTGKNPVDFLQSIDVKEVAIIGWEGKKVIAIRSGNAVPAARPKASGKYQDLAGIVFGNIFTIPDTKENKSVIKHESYYTVNNNWYIIGPKDAVDHFFDSERRHTGKYWPMKSVKLIILADDVQLSWTAKGGIKFDIFRSF